MKAEDLERLERDLRKAQDEELATGRAHAVASAHSEILQMAVDSARQKHLPASCQDAIRVLANYAGEAWQDGEKSSADLAERRKLVEQDIERQLLALLFRPAVEPNPLRGGDPARLAQALADARRRNTSSS
ncbi:MAG: hypothetical protein LC808_34255 [Actinobacteria bacterium]|nr:hypothetical protein [Actinomycetota bacterium]